MLGAKPLARDQGVMGHPQEDLGCIHHRIAEEGSLAEDNYRRSWTQKEVSLCYL